MTTPVVVGVDGSEQALRAVALAAQLAAQRSRELRIVHAFIWPELSVPLGPAPGAPASGGLAHAADRYVEEAVGHARRLAPELRVSGSVIVGAPAPVLLEAAETAELVVLGDRGLGGFTGLLIGSIAVQVSGHARCPVVVVRGDTSRTGDVVVGVDGSAESLRALAFAVEEASLRKVGVTAVRAYQVPRSDEPGDMLPLVYSPADLADDEALQLAEAVAGWRGEYSDVEIRELVLREGASRALVRASEHAALIVVGSRGAGGFAGLLLGSVSQAVLHHASCPVAIIR
jgi:nucleotide-binding universal stress UspA family protein